ncbi:MAG TPA: pilus assembly protein N-terminal domain-containing protein [Roseiarcus sp.]|nr:pilus assembly protein N-terminal domain-containing protein [Roseiarcus sp.]
MPSRLWLAAALVLASGATPARAETSTIAVTLDQAKIARLPEGTATLIVGNPMIADVTTLKDSNTMVITGKGFGETNMIAISAAGVLIEEEQIQVLPAKTVMVLQNGSSRVSYSCNPVCMPTVQLGDDDKVFKEAGEQMSTRNGYAAGGSGIATK